MFAENNGVKIWYEIEGQGDLTLVMVPGFQIIHSELFKRSFVPFLSRHMRVVTLDLRGSGKSSQTDSGYDLKTYVMDIHAVVEAAHLDRFAMAGLSCGAMTVIEYHATHPGRVTNIITLNGYTKMIRSGDYPQGMPKDVLEGVYQSWRDQPEATLNQFIKMVCWEKYSLRYEELIWKWANETSPKVWAMGFACSIFSNVDEHLENVDIPVLIIVGPKDKVVFPTASDYVHQKISGSRLIAVPDSGHGFIRTWPQVARHILDFLQPEAPRPLPQRRRMGSPKVLWISSPIGLGHVRRDLAIAQEMRKRISDLTIHWLSIDPVRSFLEDMGEQVHPLSDALLDESGHFESHGEDYSLDAVEAYWEMDKLLNNNFLIFEEAVRADEYDLVVGDESWEVVQYLHYNPPLKIVPFVFMTDFIGASTVSDDRQKQAHTYDVNGMWVEMRKINPHASDLSIFIGEPEDIPDRPFGEGLPNMRAWAMDHFVFPGYVLPFDPADYSDRRTLRQELGFSAKDKILLVAVGGTSVGSPLIEKCLACQTGLRRKIPQIRTIILCGPRIDPKSFGRYEGVEFHSFISDPLRLYAACDLAVIQGGLSTAMELTALKRPFLYFPLRDHFEQQDCVDYRLKRHNAGLRLDFATTSSGQLVEAIAANIGGANNYKPVSTQGLRMASSMIMELLCDGQRTSG